MAASIYSSLGTCVM